MHNHLIYSCVHCRRIVFALLLALLLAGQSAWATDYVDSEGVVWRYETIDANTARIIYGTELGGKTSVSIPAIIVNGSDIYTVTEIGSGAFNGNGYNGLSSVTIPACVTTISNQAFQKCTGLTTVTFAAGSQLSSIGISAFQGCSNLTSISLPYGVRTIDNSAFYQSGLTSIVIPDSVTSFGIYVLRGCSSLQSVTIGKQVQSLSGTFTQCGQLETIVIGSGVTSMSSYAFYQCSSLANIYFLPASLPEEDNSFFTNVPDNCHIYVHGNYGNQGYLSGYSNQTAIYIADCAEGITATTSVIRAGGKDYFTQGATVTLSCTPPAGMAPVYSVNSTPIAGNTFTMPAEDVSVSVQFYNNYWADLQTQLTNSSTDADYPTVITLDQDLVATSTDSYLNIPAGHHVIIDLNGHKIDRNLTEPDNNGYVFYVRGGTDDKTPSSLTIRDSQGGGTITGGYASGFNGGGAFFVTHKSTLTIEGGTITGNKSSQYGGGAITISNSTVRMTGGTITGNVGNTSNNDSFYAAGAVCLKEQSHFYFSGGSITGNLCGGHTGDTYGKDDCGGIGFDNDHPAYVNRIHLSGSYTLSGNLLGSYSNGTLTNSIPSDYLHTQKNVIVIEGAINPTAPAVITVSDRSKQACFTSGWGSHMTADPATCFTLSSFYNTSGKNLCRSGSELYIGTPEAVYWGADANHDGSSEEKAYIISTPEGLDYLASVVNGGNGCNGVFFKLGNNIAYNPNALTVDLDGDGTPDSNYTPIGNKKYYFRGTFDGQGHTISGIRTNHYNGWYIGLFGWSNGTVTGIVLRDCSFSGYQIVGGIAGYNSGAISDCRVESSVSIRGLTSADLAGSLGGITGYNSSGTIAGCLSAAAVNPEGVSANVVGGIVGNNYSTIQDCFYIGTTVKATGEVIGAICGSNQTSYSAFIANTYYVAAPNLPGQRNTYSSDHLRGVACCGRGYEIKLNEGAAFFDNARTYPVSGLAAYAEPDKEYGGQTAQFGYALRYSPTDGEPVIYSCYQQTIRLKPDLTLTGYEFGGYAATASNAEPVDVNHYTGSTGDYYSFTMPRDADVTVTAIWTTDARTLTGVSAEELAGYWATWFGHARFTLPEGAAAYTMDKDHHLYRLGDDGQTIPAGVAVVIISDKPSIALTPDSGTSTITDHAPNGGNILSGGPATVTAGQIDGMTPYVLGIVNGKLGFYEYNGGPVPAYKAYYVQ